VDRRRFLRLIGIGAILAGAGYVAYRMVTRPEYGEVDAELELMDLATGLTIPWAVRPVGNGFLVTERPGRLTYVEGGRPRVVKSFDVAAVGEAGLLGLELDPDFESNRRIYLYMSIYRDGDIVNRVVRARLDRDLRDLGTLEVILDGIPGANIHDGGRVRLGPDGYLYVTTGDANIPSLAQDPESLAGKILRIGLEGEPHPENPFGNEVYSLGHRNPQGLDWHPGTGELYSSEHGPIGHDEINIIVPGGNYGWPIYAGYSRDERYVSPVFETGDRTIAPSGASFIDGRVIGLRGYVYAVACLRGSQVFIYDPDTGETYSVLSGVLGRLRELIPYGEGFIVATSNRDGRGSPREGDDRLVYVRRTA